MTAEDYQAVRESVMRHEGFSAHPIPDSHGTLSIGHGWNLNTEGCDEEIASFVLDHILAKRLVLLSRLWPPFLTCDGPRQRVVIEMAYQLGVAGLLEFRHMLHFVAAKDYEQAAQHILNSKLGRIDTPARAKDYAATMRSQP